MHMTERGGELKKVYSTCSWTIPGHESILRGKLPHSKELRPDEVLENEYNWGAYPMPMLHDYSFASTALPYLGKKKYTETDIQRYFDDFLNIADCRKDQKLLDHAEKKIKSSDVGFFGLINLGGTHYPYNHYDISNKEFREKWKNGGLQIKEAHEKQKEACEDLIEMISDFRKCLPSGTQVIVTADHAELFGEEGGFGHTADNDAHFHKKLYEVPLIEWVEK
ncbi:MAG: hypothetical protein ABEJ98_04825 [Candidatus Nanohaloarchaea archaeon]